jgi:hypothetical protein
MIDATGDSQRQDIEDSESPASGGINGTTANSSTASATTVDEKDPPTDGSSRTRTFSLAQMLVDTGILQREEVARAQQLAWEER